MIKGEERDLEIWEIISNAFSFIKKNKNFNGFNNLFNLRFLTQLGYVDFDNKFLNKSEREIISFFRKLSKQGNKKIRRLCNYPPA